MEPNRFGRVVAGVGVAFVLLVLSASATYVVDAGTRGIRVTLGRVSNQFLPEGFGVKAPFVTTIVPVSVRQRTRAVQAECFSSDLQQVMLEVRVLYRVPEQSVVQIYRQYAGDPFDSLIAPRVLEAVKEVTALMTAEQIVKHRGDVKQKTLAAARGKIGAILAVEDIVIRDIALSEQLERAIEAKMVAEQQAAQARFTQMKVEVEAETAVIRAKGEAEAIRARGEALRLNASVLRLKVVERWKGKSPLVVPAGGAGPAAMLLPMGGESRRGAP